MRRKRSNETEPEFLLYGTEDQVADHLRCIACGAWIWSPSHNLPVWKQYRGKWYAMFRKCTYDADVAYWKHVRNCFGLKKLIVLQRSRYTQHETV